MRRKQPEARIITRGPGRPRRRDPAAATPAPPPTTTGSGGGGHRGTSGSGGSSPLQLNFKNHCLFCLERQTPEQILSIVKLNPKRLEDFQPIISYLTGTDPTIDRRERECKNKKIPMMGNLPPMCQFCYNVFARLYELHVNLQSIQDLIQEQTMKGRRILEKGERTRKDAKNNVNPTPTGRQRFYETLQDEGMPKEQFELVKGFVDNLHDLITSQGDNEVKYPSYPDLKYGQPRKLPLPVYLSSALHQQRPTPVLAPAPPRPPTSGGILIPVQLLPMSSAGGTTIQTSTSFNSFPGTAPGVNTTGCQFTLAPTTNLCSTATASHPRISTGRVVVTGSTRSQPDPLSIIVKERDNVKIVDGVIDLCDDSDEDIKSVKEEEEEAMEMEMELSNEEDNTSVNNDDVVQMGVIDDEDTKSAKGEGEAEEDWDSDREDMLNDPLWSPPSQAVQSSDDDDLEANIPVEAVLNDEEIKTEDPLAYEDESIQPRTSLPKVLTIAPAPTTTVLTFTNMITLGGSGSMPFQLLPLMTTTSVPLFSGPITNLDPLASTSTSVDKAVPQPPKPKRKRKPRIRIRKKKEPKPKRKKVRKPKPNSPFFQRCDMCNEFLERDAAAMNDHLKTHTGRDGYSCTACNRTFATKRLFFTHIRRRNGAMQKECDQQRRKLLPEYYSPTCIICDEDIPVKMESFRLREFYVHLFSVHEKDTSLEDSHECKICGAKFRTENGLDFHINEHMHESRKKVIERLTSVADLRLGLPQKRYTLPLPGLERAKSGLKNLANKESCSSNKISCIECAKCFDTEEMLNGHLKLEHTLRCCKLCDYSCSRFETYMVHLRYYHPTDKPCDICWTGEGKDVKFERSSTLRSHYFEVHGVGRQLECEFCDRKFLCRNSFSTHQRMGHKVHPAGSKRERRETFERFHCKNSSYDGGKESPHKRISRKMTTVLKRQRGIVPGTNTTTTEEQEFQCEHCLNGYSNKTIVNKDALYSRARLERHMATHHRHKCPSCEDTFLSVRDLNVHGRKEHPEVEAWTPHECPTCKRTIFGSLQKLKTHMANHLNPYDFSCPICSRKFRSYLTLYQHKYVHSKEKPFICEQCGRGFTQKRLLQWHMQVHLPGGRPKRFTCEFCGKSYGDKIYMVRHIKAHHPSDEAT